MWRKLFVLLTFLGGLLAPWEASSQAGLTPCGSAITLSVTNTTSNAQLSNCGGVVLVWNVGTVEAFYTFGTASTTAATTSSWSIPSTSFVVLNLPTNRPYLAAITASSTTTIRITQGNAR